MYTYILDTERIAKTASDGWQGKGQEETADLASGCDPKGLVQTHTFDAS